MVPPPELVFEAEVVIAPTDVPTPELEVDGLVGALVLRREERRRELAHDPVVDVLSGPVSCPPDKSRELLVPILLLANDFDECEPLFTRFVGTDSFVDEDNELESILFKCSVFVSECPEEDCNREESDVENFFRGLPFRLSESNEREATELSLSLSTVKLIAAESVNQY